MAKGKCHLKIFCTSQRQNKKNWSKVYDIESSRSRHKGQRGATRKSFVSTAFNCLHIGYVYSVFTAADMIICHYIKSFVNTLVRCLTKIVTVTNITDTKWNELQWTELNWNEIIWTKRNIKLKNHHDYTMYAWDVKKAIMMDAKIADSALMMSYCTEIYLHYSAFNAIVIDRFEK